MLFLTPPASGKGERKGSEEWRGSKRRKRLSLFVKQAAARDNESALTRRRCLSVCLSPKCVLKKRDFLKKTKQSRAMISIETNRKSYMGISKIRYWTHKIQDGGHAPTLKSVNRHISTKNHPILTKFGTQQQIWNSMK